MREQVFVFVSVLKNIVIKHIHENNSSQKYTSASYYIKIFPSSKSGLRNDVLFHFVIMLPVHEMKLHFELKM